MRIILIAMMSLLIASCDKPEIAQKDIDRSGQPIKVTVTVYDNYPQLIEARKKHDGLIADTIEGFAFWNKTEPAWCEIHVVKPKYVVDRTQMRNWGHELMHCVYGSYHKEVI